MNEVQFFFPIKVESPPISIEETIASGCLSKFVELLVAPSNQLQVSFLVLKFSCFILVLLFHASLNRHGSLLT